MGLVVVGFSTLVTVAFWAAHDQIIDDTLDPFRTIDGCSELPGS